MGFTLIINPLLNESHFVSSFVSGLRPEIKLLVTLANPNSLRDAFETTKSYEESFQALAKLLTPKYSPHYTKACP